MSTPQCFALPGNEALARTLAAAYGSEPGECIVRRFPDGESYLRFLSPVRDRPVVIVCSLDRPDDKLVQVYLAARTLRELGAARIVLVAPYLAYMRQDTVFKAGEGVSARHVADLLSGCIDGLVTVDPHLHRIERLERVYPVALRVVSAAAAIAEWIRAQVPRPVLIGPDEESEQWVAAIAGPLGCPYRVLRKQRRGDRDVSVDVGALTIEADTTPVLVDDIVSSGATVIQAIEKLSALGCAPPVCVVVHGLFADAALASIRKAGAARVAACSTVPHQAECIDLGDGIASALTDLVEQLH